MISARGNAQPRPLKWFSIAQCFRYERMALGRKREHYQWNLDIVGVSEVTAEAELLAAAVDALERLGLTKEDIVVRVSHRRLLAAVLQGLEIEEDRWSRLLSVIDKRGKESEETVWRLLLELGVPEGELRRLLGLLGENQLDAFRRFLENQGIETRSVEEIRQLFEYLDTYGIRDFCEFCPSIVRGLPYYTGIVFECFDRRSKFRAVFGGGRYDNLLELFGAGSLPAVGLGFGDVVIQEILEARSAHPWPARRTDFFLIPYSEAERPLSIRVVQQLRKKGFVADLLLGSKKLKVALRESARSSPESVVLFLPEELARGFLVLRDMASGREQQVSVEAFLRDPRGFVVSSLEAGRGSCRESF
jgi:histidyl-tRNA synthetase